MNLQEISINRTQLMGLSAIFIMIFHLGLINLLNIGVDFFLVLSAIGSFHSLSRNFDLKQFYIKRLKRIIPTFLSVSITLIIVCFITGSDRSIIIWLGLGVFIGDFSFWFIPLILICYSLAPILYKIALNQYAFIHISILSLISFAIAYIYKDAYILFARLPIYFIAIYFAKYVINKTEISNRNLYIIMFISIIFIILAMKLINTSLGWYYVFIFYSLITIPILISITKIVSLFNSNLLTFIGSISLETYLVQEFICFPITWYITSNYYIFIIISSILTILFAYTLSTIIKSIMLKL